MLIMRVFDTKSQQMGDVIILLSNFPDHDKEEFFRGIGEKVAAEFMVVSALFIAEAWMLSVSPDAMPSFRPSEHPASIEGFSFYAQTIQGKGVFKSFKLVRDEKKHIAMGDLHFEGKGEDVKSTLLHHFFIGYVGELTKRM